MSKHEDPEGRYWQSDRAVQYMHPLAAGVDPSLLVDQGMAGGDRSQTTVRAIEDGH